MRRLISVGRIVSTAVVLTALVGCATPPPANVDNICDIFAEKKGWYDDVADASEKWGVSVSHIMAFIYQESRFVADAKPPRRKILWFIPGPRLSSAYGYPQAKDETWVDYQRATGAYGADRDDFEDSADFIGWYVKQSYQRCGIRKGDVANSYLAYHEGLGGYNRGTYRSKDWLKKIAYKVNQRSQTYASQLKNCESGLERKSWFDWF